MTNPDTGNESRVVPGELRRQPAKVGRHQPPGHDSLDGFMVRFGESYAPEKHHGVAKLVAAAAHHRLMWIHPFLDGNGRVARLFTEAYLHRIPPRLRPLVGQSRSCPEKYRLQGSSDVGQCTAKKRFGRQGVLVK